MLFQSLKDDFENNRLQKRSVTDYGNLMSHDDIKAMIEACVKDVMEML